jgi:gamma-glutamyltranspeptidase/glutathione hydrolase
MPRVAVAAVSTEAARAGARIAHEGGNAVDAAVSAALLSVVTHPGMCSLGGGAFATLLPASAPPITIDGGIAFPGRGAGPAPSPDAAVEVEMGYAGGVSTTVGPASVGVPGLLAALHRLSRDHGRVPWEVLVQPAVEGVRDGFPLPPACHRYLQHAGDAIYRRDPRSRRALYDGGELRGPGDPIRVPGLADSLEAIGREGADLFYRGELGRRIASHVREAGGALTREDLSSYRAVRRDPVTTPLDGWEVASNPLPALGGTVLSALLRLCRELPAGRWDAGDVGQLAAIQAAVEEYRRREMATPGERESAADRLRELAEAGDPGALRASGGAAATGGGSGSTLHVSAADSEGRACAITCSDGYGSGVMPPGTGIWLNNCLGERELAPGGPGSRPPGTRLASNMAPTVARGEADRRIAAGSPGGPRIPAIVAQVLLHRIRRGARLEAAVEAPRILAAPGRGAGDGPRVAVEPGLPTGGVTGDVRIHGERAMYFGGVAAAEVEPRGEPVAAADPRRGGGTAVGGRG